MAFLRSSGPSGNSSLSSRAPSSGPLPVSPNVLWRKKIAQTISEETGSSAILFSSESKEILEEIRRQVLDESPAQAALLTEHVLSAFDHIILLLKNDPLFFPTKLSLDDCLRQIKSREWGHAVILIAGAVESGVATAWYERAIALFIPNVSVGIVCVAKALLKGQHADWKKSMEQFERAYNRGADSSIIRYAQKIASCSEDLLESKTFSATWKAPDHVIRGAFAACKFLHEHKLVKPDPDAARDLMRSIFFQIPEGSLVLEDKPSYLSSYVALLKPTPSEILNMDGKSLANRALTGDVIAQWQLAWHKLTSGTSEGLEQAACLFMSIIVLTQRSDLIKGEIKKSEKSLPMLELLIAELNHKAREILASEYRFKALKWTQWVSVREIYFIFSKFMKELTKLPKGELILLFLIEKFPHFFSYGGSDGYYGSQYRKSIIGLYGHGHSPHLHPGDDDYNGYSDALSAMSKHLKPIVNQYDLREECKEEESEVRCAAYYFNISEESCVEKFFSLRVYCEAVAKQNRPEDKPEDKEVYRRRIESIFNKFSNTPQKCLLDTMFLLYGFSKIKDKSSVTEAYNNFCQWIDTGRYSSVACSNDFIINITLYAIYVVRNELFHASAEHIIQAFKHCNQVYTTVQTAGRSSDSDKLVFRLIEALRSLRIKLDPLKNVELYKHYAELLEKYIKYSWTDESLLGSSKEKYLNEIATYKKHAGLPVDSVESKEAMSVEGVSAPCGPHAPPLPPAFAPHPAPNVDSVELIAASGQQPEGKEEMRQQIEGVPATPFVAVSDKSESENIPTPSSIVVVAAVAKVAKRKKQRQKKSAHAAFFGRSDEYKEVEVASSEYKRARGEGMPVAEVTADGNPVVKATQLLPGQEMLSICDYIVGWHRVGDKDSITYLGKAARVHRLAEDLLIDLAFHKQNPHACLRLMENALALQSYKSAFAFADKLGEVTSGSRYQFLCDHSDDLSQMFESAKHPLVEPHTLERLNQYRASFTNSTRTAALFEQTVRARASNTVSAASDPKRMLKF